MALGVGGTVGGGIFVLVGSATAQAGPAALAAFPIAFAAALLIGALMAAIAATGSVTIASAAGGFLFVLHFVPPLIALVVLRRRGGPRPRFATPAPWVVLPLAFAASGVLIVASGGVGMSIGGAWLHAGGVAYVVFARSRMLEQTIENVGADR